MLFKVWYGFCSFLQCHIHLLTIFIFNYHLDPLNHSPFPIHYYRYHLSLFHLPTDLIMPSPLIHKHISFAYIQTNHLEPQKGITGVLSLECYNAQHVIRGVSFWLDCEVVTARVRQWGLAWELIPFDVVFVFGEEIILEWEVWHVFGSGVRDELEKVFLISLVYLLDFLTSLFQNFIVLS